MKRLQTVQTKKKDHRLFRLSFSTKIILSNIVIVTMSFVMAGVFFFSSYYNSTLAKSYEAIGVLSTQLKTTLDFNFASMNNLNYTIINTSRIRDWINGTELYSKEDPDYDFKISKMIEGVENALIFDNAWIAKHYQSITLFIEEEEIVLRTRTVITDNKIAYYKKVLETISDKQTGTIYIPPSPSHGGGLIIKKVLNVDSKQKLFIISELKERDFAKNI